METVFIEELVHKKKTAKDYLAVIAVLALGAAIAAILLAIILPVFFKFGTLVLILVFAVFYGVFCFLQSRDVEYEYSLVNFEVDIDKIIGKKRRKRMVTVYIRNLEAFGTRKNPEFNGYMENAAVKKVYACRSKNDHDVFFVVYDEGATKIMLLFNPSKKIIDHIAKCNPLRALI